MRIKRLDERLSEVCFPSIQKVDVLAIEPNDTVIICAGFEDRSLSVIESIISSDIKGISIIQVDYLPLVEENKSDKLLELCRQRNYKVSQVTYDRENPESAGYLIVNHIDVTMGNIWIDISGMSRLLVVQLIEAISKSIGFKKVNILYAEAEFYPPARDEVYIGVEKARFCQNIGIFLSSGVFDVCVVPELSSVALQGQPIRLVAFPSFNCNQLMALMSSIQPSYVSIINGMPPKEGNQWRLQAIRDLNCIESIQHMEELTTSTLDYRETISALLSIYGRYAEIERLVVAPVGSKMQSVAVGIIRCYLNDIQIAYPTPLSFIEPEKYTEGSTQIFSLSLSRMPQPSEI